jgi:hypothetical protein
VTKYSVFKKLCQLLMIFHPKKNWLMHATKYVLFMNWGEGKIWH